MLGAELNSMDILGDIHAVTGVGPTLQRTTAVFNTSTDSGFSDDDEIDGEAKLVDELAVRMTTAPTPGMVQSLRPDVMADSLSLSKKLGRADEGRSSVVRQIGRAMKRMKKLGVFSCVNHKNKVRQCGLSEVLIHDAKVAVGSDDAAQFGMHLKSVEENGIMRHFVAHKEKGSLADSFDFRNDDELLMIDDCPLVGVATSEALHVFLTLPENKAVSFVSRRAREQCAGHIVYYYLVLTGTIHIFDDFMAAMNRMSLEAAVGIHDLLDVRFIGRDQRSFRSRDDVIMRVTDGKIHLDSQNNTPFYFDVLQYEAVQVQHKSYELVQILHIRHVDDSSCYVLSADEEQATVRMMQYEKAALCRTGWLDFAEAGIKWLTKIPQDGSETYIFQCLSNSELFLSVSEGELQCVEKSDWGDAQTDTCTHFRVTPPI